MTEPTPTSFEKEPRIVDEVVVLDLDRTLVNSSAVTHLVLTRMAHHGVSANRISEAIAHAEAQTGNSFYLFDYIVSEFSIDMLETIVGEIMEDDTLLKEHKDDLLCQGADMLVYALEAQGTPAMILTYGEYNYQSFKIDLFRKLTNKTNKELPGIVTDVANKSMWVQENWFTRSDDLGEVPIEINESAFLARLVSVVDDKASHLQSRDSRVVGVLVDNNPSPANGVISTLELAQAVDSGICVYEVASVYERREGFVGVKLTNS